VLVWSLLSGAVALSVNVPDGWMPFAFLLVFRFLFGMVQAGGFPALARVLADWIPSRDRGFAQGLVWTFSRLGGAVVQYLFLWLFMVFQGWTTPLWLMAGLGVLWCAVFWPWFRNRPGEMRMVNAAERELIESRPAATQPHSSEPVKWSQFLKSRNVWALCLLYGCLGFGGTFLRVCYLFTCAITAISLRETRPGPLRCHSPLALFRACWAACFRIGPYAAGAAGSGDAGSLAASAWRWRA
jgi:MFS family permease